MGTGWRPYGKTEISNSSTSKSVGSMLWDTAVLERPPSSCTGHRGRYPVCSLGGGSCGTGSQPRSPQLWHGQSNLTCGLQLFCCPRSQLTLSVLGAGLLRSFSYSYKSLVFSWRTHNMQCLACLHGFFRLVVSAPTVCGDSARLGMGSWILLKRVSDLHCVLALATSSRKFLNSCSLTSQKHVNIKNLFKINCGGC